MTIQTHDSHPSLAVGGLRSGDPVDLSHGDLANLPAEFQLHDVGKLLPGRRGTALRFRGLVEHLAPEESACFVHVLSSDGSFSASLDRDLLMEQGIIVYALDGAELPEDAGGPFRLFVTDSEDCSINVKSVASITFANSPGAHTAACAEDPTDG